METMLDNELFDKFQAVVKGPDKELLKNFINILYERIEEEYDTEPLSPEEVEMVAASEEQFKQGEYITLEDYRAGKRL
jgi:hypothetical protein